MNVQELLILCNKWKRQGKGKWPVQLMEVEDGIPFASDVTMEAAQSYDGERIWIYSESERILPDWAKAILKKDGFLYV